ncbi:universal stress protein [Longispora sp. K20-0274]|uniref:universal stress protein n=1 Tax=Longispora sp. K20-0274 TaxID=3088255 RepID=UPI00399B4A52
MSHTDAPAVLVGVDGSQISNDALDFAADQAAAKGLRLEIMHSFVMPALYAPVLAVPYPPEFTEPGPAVVAILTDAEARALHRHPDLDIDTHLIHTTPAAWLVERSGGAAMVVVGSRGSGGFAGLVLGSVSAQVATHAHCPVVVVRGETQRPSSAPVLVGVDGTENTVAALEFAFAEADRRGAPLRALYVWHSVPDGMIEPSKLARFGLAEAENVSLRILSEALAGFTERYPAVQVTEMLTYDRHPEEILLEESTEAGLVVVGSRGRGEVASLLLGSVSYALIHHADCPVVVVHPTKQ